MTAQHSGFWSGQTLEKRGKEVIFPFTPKQLDCASYRLRIGQEVYVSPSSAASEDATIRQLAEREAFTIPPGQFAFLLTEEVVRIPNDALGLISIRAKVKFAGLVNVSGFHVDPGFRGKLIFAVFNAGPTTIHLRRGDPIFLIWFATLDEKSTADHVKIPDNPQMHIHAELIRGVSGEVLSLKSLSARIQRVERDHTVLRWALGIVLAIAISAMLIPSLKSCADQPPGPSETRNSK